MIPKHFRCGDPSQKCALSVTREIIKEVAKDGKDCACPCANPNCVDFREPVGLIDGISGGRAKVVYTVAVLVAAFIVGMLIFGGGNASLEQLKKLQARLVPLDSAVVELGKKTPSSPDGKPTSIRVAALEREVSEITKQAEEALANKEISSVALALQNVEQQITLVKHIIETIDQPATGGGVNAAEATRLIVKLQQLGDDTEMVLETIPADSPESIAQFEDFIKDVQRSAGKARQISSPPQVKTGSPESELVKKQLQAMFDGLSAVKDRLMKLPPPQVDPWDPTTADIRLAACGDLTRDLVGPLAAAWSATEIVVGAEGRIFLSSESKGKVLVESYSAEDGFSKLAAGKLAVFFADRAPTESELNQFGPGFKTSRSVVEVVALDALTLLVNPEVSFNDTYKIGEAYPLRLAAGPAGSSIRRYAELFGISSPDALNVGGDQAVMSDPSLLALSLYHQDGTNHKGKFLAVKSSPESLALKPSPFTIATEDYCFSYRIVAWTASKPTTEALSLVKFVTSNEGQTIVAEQGFVDLRLRPMQGDVPPEILAALGAALGVDSVNSAIRLSTNFRFEVGEATLDLKAQADLERLPRFIADFYATHKVVILGFTDSSGPVERHTPLSKERAETVAVELRRSKVDTRSDGLGPAFPVDTNDTPAGKEKNRRAEVWVAKP